MEPITLELDYLPPSVNRMHAVVVPRGKTHGFLARTRVARQFTDDIKKAWTGLGLPRFSGWITIKLAVWFPDRRRRDAHNLLKALLDALQEAGAFEDDQKVLPSVDSVAIRPGRPGMSIKFGQAEPWQYPESDRQGNVPS